MMKLSFSTLGCPEWPFEKIVEKGEEYGFEALGFRGVQGEMDLLKVPALSEKNRAATLARLARAGLAISMLLTGCRFTAADKAERRRHVEEAKRNIDLAAALGTDAIRIFGGPVAAGVKREDAHAWLVESCRELGDYAGPKQVYVALETHDDFTDTALVRDLMERTAHPWVRVLWDVHHPYRFAGESMKQAFANIGKYVVDTHFKDSFKTPTEKEGSKYCLLGEGDVPLREALQILKDAGYDRYLTLEWEKAWHPYLADASVAFPQYVKTMREYLAALR